MYIKIIYFIKSLCQISLSMLNNLYIFCLQQLHNNTKPLASPKKVTQLALRKHTHSILYYFYFLCCLFLAHFPILRTHLEYQLLLRSQYHFHKEPNYHKND